MALKKFVVDKYYRDQQGTVYRYVRLNTKTGERVFARLPRYGKNAYEVVRDYHGMCRESPHLSIVEEYTADETVYGNVYRKDDKLSITNELYATRQEADDNARSNRVGRVRIDLKKGRFDD